MTPAAAASSTRAWSASACGTSSTKRATSHPPAASYALTRRRPTASYATEAMAPAAPQKGEQAADPHAQPPGTHPPALLLPNFGRTEQDVLRAQDERISTF